MARTNHIKRLIIVVPIGAGAIANERAKDVDSRGGDLTFTVGLSATGKSPATHYWCSWSMTSDDEANIRAKMLTDELIGKAQVFDGGAMTPDDVLAATGLRRIVNEGFG